MQTSNLCVTVQLCAPCAVFNMWCVLQPDIQWKLFNIHQSNRKFMNMDGDKILSRYINTYIIHGHFQCFRWFFFSAGGSAISNVWFSCRMLKESNERGVFQSLIWNKMETEKEWNVFFIYEVLKHVIIRISIHGSARCTECIQWYLH